MATGGTTAVLRTGDRRLAERVRRLCALAGLDLVVVGLGEEPPTAAVLLDDRSEPVGLAWQELEAGVLELGPHSLGLPEDAEQILGHLAAAATPRRARVVGLVGASGGLGTSALGAVLARLTVAAGHATALVDLDPAGGGLDILLGIEHDAGPRWADVLAERGGFPPDRLMGALPTWHGARVLSADIRGGSGAADAVALEAAGALTRAADVVVLDLPRAVLGHAASPDHLALCDDVVLVAGCDTRAAAAAAAAARVLTALPTWLVVRGPAAGALHPEDVAEACGVPLTARLRPERAFAAGVERGLSPGDQRRGPLQAAGRRLLRELSLA